MKKLLFFCCVFISFGSVSAQTIIQYGNRAVSKEEFLRAFNRNRTTNEDREKAVRDYTELYTNFKLKVAAAEAKGLQHSARVKTDTESFREQVVSSYLSDPKAVDKLTDEALSRAGRDIRVQYIFLPYAGKDSLAVKAAAAAASARWSDTQSADALSEIVTDLKAKGMEAQSADAGYVTVFALPYAYENLIYSTPAGKAAAPFNNGKGFMIVKPILYRPAAGRWTIAQILLAYPPNSSYEIKLAVKEKADSIWNLLQKGMRFDSAALAFSQDRVSYQAGGMLPEFTAGKFIPAFEEKVFQLRTDGEISKPFETEYGYHIVKRISQKPLPPLSDADYRAETKQKVMSDGRMSESQAKFREGVKLKTGFRRVPGVSDEVLSTVADSTIYANSVDEMLKNPIAKKKLFVFSDGTATTGADWINFIKRVYPPGDMPKDKFEDKYNGFTEFVLMDYYKKNLEKFDPDFRAQMQEFREGNMLFEIMETEVWSKGATDSTALKAFYQMHGDNYIWAPSADVILVSTPSKADAEKAVADMKAGKSWQTIALQSDNRIQADSSRYELSNLPGEYPDAKPNSFTPVIVNADGTASFIKFVDVHPGGARKSFSEARGMLINDYQNVLEKKWLDELRKKYPVKVNEAVVREVIASKP